MVDDEVEVLEGDTDDDGAEPINVLNLCGQVASETLDEHQAHNGLEVFSANLNGDPPDEIGRALADEDYTLILVPRSADLESIIAQASDPGKIILLTDEEELTEDEEGPFREMGIEHFADSESLYMEISDCLGFGEDDP